MSLLVYGAVVASAFFTFVKLYEERVLSERYGEAYRRYQARAGMDSAAAALAGEKALGGQEGLITRTRSPPSTWSLRRWRAARPCQRLAQ